MKRQIKTLCDVLGPGPYQLVGDYNGTDWCALCGRQITVCYKVRAVGREGFCVVGCECVTKRHFESQGQHSADLAREVQEAKKAKARAKTAAERAAVHAALDAESAALWAEAISHGDPRENELCAATWILGPYLARELRAARTRYHSVAKRRKVIDKSRVALANALAARGQRAADEARLQAIINASK